MSKITSETLKRAVMNLQPSKLNVIPPGIAGLSKNTRISMAEKGKFEKIDRLKAGDKVVSFNTMTEQCEDANVLDVGPLTSIETLVSFCTITDNMGGTVDCYLTSRFIAGVIRILIANGYGLWIFSETIAFNHNQAHTGRGSLMGSTSTVKVTKKFAKNSLFYKLEVYPNNSFFVNSNMERKLSLPSIGVAGVPNQRLSWSNWISPREIWNMMHGGLAW